MTPGVPAGMPPISGVPTYDADGNEVPDNHIPSEYLPIIHPTEEDPRVEQPTPPEPIPGHPDTPDRYRTPGDAG